MTNAEFKALKAKIREKKDKANDLDIIVAEMMKLPWGQLKKLLTDEVAAVLEKHGVTE